MKHTDHRGVFCTGFLVLVVAVALLVGMSGCVGVNLGSAHTLRGNIEGSGEVVTRAFDVADFDRIKVEGDYIVTYTKSEECALSVEMQESLFGYITVESGGGELVISSRDGTLHNSDMSNRAPKLHISAPTLSGMDFSGAVSTEDSDIIEGKGLDLSIAGGGAVELGVAVEELRVFTGGASSITLSGTAANAEIDMAGAGSLNALELATKTAEVNMSGASSGSITCSEALEVSISGAGSFKYRGGAALTESIAGFGSVTKAD